MDGRNTKWPQPEVARHRTAHAEVTKLGYWTKSWTAVRDVCWWNSPESVWPKAKTKMTKASKNKVLRVAFKRRTQHNKQTINQSQKTNTTQQTDHKSITKGKHNTANRPQINHKRQTQHKKQTANQSQKANTTQKTDHKSVTKGEHNTANRPQINYKRLTQHRKQTTNQSVKIMARYLHWVYSDHLDMRK